MKQNQGPETVDQRCSPRFSARFVSVYAADKREGSGVLTEVSYTGARLADTSFRPDVNSPVRLQVMVRSITPFELQGRVTRLTKSGFAIRYDLFDPNIRRLVDDVAAMVEVPPVE